MSRFLFMLLGVIFLLTTQNATAGPPSSSDEGINVVTPCDTSCPIPTTTAPEDCAIDFVECIVDQPSECDISNQTTNIEDARTEDISPSSSMESDINKGAITEAITAIEVNNVGTSISIAVLFNGHENNLRKSSFFTGQTEEVSKRIIWMAQINNHFIS